MKSRLTVAIVALLLMSAVFAPVAAQDAAEETPVRFIELAGPAATGDAELSGLAWYGDTLVLLPENPFLYAEDGTAGAFFALRKRDILAYLDADSPPPLTPLSIPLYGPDIYDTVTGFEVEFDGFEAITFVSAANAFADDQVFLTIEASTVSGDDPTMRGYLVWGTVLGNLEGIQLRLDDRIALPTQTDFNNMSYESLLSAGDAIIAFYEANGATANPGAFAVRVDLATGATSELPMPPLEFRLTDVTALAADGTFWATNFFFPGETFLAAANDPLFAQYGRGATQPEGGPYERLVKFELNDGELRLADTAPVQIVQPEGNTGHNWEGIALLDDRGALVVTDRYPRTRLGLVALPPG